MHRSIAPVLVALGLLVAAAPASAATIGLNIGGGAASAGLIPTAAETKTPTARAFMIWDEQSSPDQSVLNAWDGIVNGWARNGMKGVIVVTGLGKPPVDKAAYANFVATMAQRYGDKVAAWEIWNEEDEQEWWGAPGGDPEHYARLLKVTYAAVHPYGTVIVGGMVGNDYQFLSKLYDFGAGGSFDGVGVHTDTACAIVPPDSFYRDPNGAVARFSFLGFRSVHDVMVAHGDGNKPIWMTEFGWNTYTGLCNTGAFAGKKPGGVDKNTQAQYLAQAAHCLSSYPYVSDALWFTLKDDADPPEQQYGLLTTRAAQKPAWQSFIDVVAGRDSFAGKGCGDFDGPIVAIKSPLDGSKFIGPLPIDVEAADSNGIGRFSIYIDGKKIRNYTNRKDGKPVLDPKDWAKTLRADFTNPPYQKAKHFKAGTNHTIRIEVLDGAMNRTVRIITVRKIDPGSLQQIQTAFRPLRVTGSGNRRIVKTKLQAIVTGPAPPFRAIHKIRIVFQKQVAGGAWRTAHKYTKTAKAPINLPVTLESANWRVQAIFDRKSPFKGTKSEYTLFQV
jgi:hypothetical protein